LITSNSQNDSASSVDDNHAEVIEKKKSELLEEELFKEDNSVQEEPEITREQLALSKKLLNWRTLVPLVIVIAAVAFFVRQEHIDPQKTWIAIRSANFIFFTGCLCCILPIISPTRFTLAASPRKCGIYSSKWCEVAKVLEAGGNHLYFLVC